MSTEIEVNEVDIIQLLTIEALVMIWYRPESTNIDRGGGGAEVNIGILRSISYHVQCLNSQQLFYYIISLNKKSNNNNKILAVDYVLDSLDFFFFWHDDELISFR